MKWIKSLRRPLVKACSVALIAGCGIAYLPSVFAATPAGTQIRNLATVTYEDAVGNPYTAQSNEAVVTVAQVYSATVGTDNAVDAAASQTVYLPHVLTNTGNGADIYDLTAVNDTSITDSIDSSSIEIYHDTNGNGVPDSGEPVVSSLNLDPYDPVTNGVANLVIAVQVPNTATNGQTLGVILTAEARNGTPSSVTNSVDDLTAGNGPDNAEGTNQSLITVTSNAVLVVTKSAVHDPVLKQITYTVNVRNNGNKTANDVVIFDGLPEGTTLVSSSVSGLLGTNGDTIMDPLDTAVTLSETGLGYDLNANTVTGDDDEATLGIDLNSDGDTTDSGVLGVYAVDAELAQASNVSLTFTVQYDEATLPSLVVTNTAYASGDTDGVNGVDDLVSSNEVDTIIGNTYGVEIADTGANPGPGVNDGGDDDASEDDIQTVDVVSTGTQAVFSLVVTNKGNANDVFELSVVNSTFPAGTAFTFYDATGNVPLSDSNGSGVDTGVVPGNDATLEIVVRATLPAGFSGTGDFDAVVTATSANDPSATKASDPTTIRLEAVVEAVADLHNAPGGASGVDDDALGTPEYEPVTTFAGQIGNTVNIPLYIDNDTATSDSFVLSAGSSWDAATSTLGALPAGWSVEFFLGSGGVPVGTAISNSGAVPPGLTDYEIIAVVSIPNDGALAATDFSFDNDADGTDETIDGNTTTPGDGDGDYPIFFRIVSPTTGATDIKLDAIDVDANRALSLVTPGINQVEGGGTVVYNHTLSNSGNVDEGVEITASNSQTGWTNSISIDTDGNGSADIDVANLTIGSTITVQLTDGSTVSIDIADADGDLVPELVVPAGVSLPLEAVVFAPANGAPNELDILTIDATNADTTTGAPSAQVTDQTTIISGQVRLVKTVAVDAACDGNPDPDAATGFAQTQITGVEPGQCVIWQVVATNQGDATASNVIIYDAVTAFSDFEVDSLAYCLTQNCTPDDTITDAIGDDAGEIDGSAITFYVGNNPDPLNQVGGELVAGEQATVWFRVKVQ